MPGRQSNVSATSNLADDTTLENSTAKGSKDRDGLSVEDLSLPRSMIARLAKGVLPANTQIHKDALLALHKSATVFVSYLASTSNENTQASGKKTISPLDVIAALEDAELDAFLPRLEAELKKYNEIQSDKRNTYRRKVKEGKAPLEAKGEGESDVHEDTPTNDHVAARKQSGHDDERPVKKLKKDNGRAGLPVSESNGEDEDEDDDNEDEADDVDDSNDEEDIADDDVEADDEVIVDEGADEDSLDDTERTGMQDEALDDPESD